jgi:hypothetical protein
MAVAVIADTPDGQPFHALVEASVPDALAFHLDGEDIVAGGDLVPFPGAAQ